MAVIQYYLNGRQYADLVDRAELLGLSEHQLAKHLALLSTATDADVLKNARATAGRQRSVPKIGQS